MVSHQLGQHSRSVAYSPYRKYQYARNDSTGDTGSWLTRERRVHTAIHSRAMACSNSIAHAFTRFEFPLLLVSGFQFSHHCPTHCTLLPSPPTQPLSNAATTTTTDSHPSNIHRFLPTTRLYLLHFSRFDDIALALSTVPPAVNNTESLSMNSWVRRQERTVRGKGAERQTKGEDEGKRSEKRWRGGERTTKRSAGYADSTCVRESTATFPHILSPCRQRARVQSAPIYRGGKAAAAYLVEYLPLSTRGRCTYRVVTLRCQHTEKACTRACALECALVVS